jgi:ribosomal-protein-alanine N-acetyltransferase
MFDFSAFPVIETNRLKLRALCPADANAIFAIRSDYEVTKYNSGAAYTDIAQASGLIDRSIAGYNSKSSLYWAMSIKDSGEVVGQLGYNCWDQDNHSAEIGFDLRRDQWGKGIMKEALTAILKYGFESMSLNRIGAQVSTYNDSSVGILTRLGFLHEGTQRDQYFEDGRYHDLKLFALLKRECAQELLGSESTVTYVVGGDSASA